ncbi:MAG: MBL fold metallo-hydrolase [Rhodospirillaceae bacterium]|nr:MBL fold metallo-hydrolase [Rhodospirillaceae bacterium]
MLFRQLFEPQSSTYTYMLACSEAREAIIIDPVFEQARRDSALIEELDLTLVATLETHIHADHVTGGWLLKERFGSQFMVAEADEVEGADRLLRHDDHVRFGGCHVAVRATPGHTASCLTFVLHDRSMAFTGDCLMIRGCGRTDFQGGSAERLYRSVHDQILSLPDSCLLYPGHDYRGLTVSSVGEERRHNPRLGGELSCSDFTGYMDNLGLPHPKQMDIAVPANLRCGQPDACSIPNEQPDWAPLNLTFAGVWEVPPQWVEENLSQIQVLDVREEEEFSGPMGHIPDAILIPLGKLSEGTGELDTDKPVVAVCRAGGRSAQATNILRKAGFSRVANLPGGMLRWRAMNLATISASDDC